MAEENKSITLKGILKTIWLKKWVALIVAVAVVLVCAISLFYGYNAKEEHYEIEFSLNLPGNNSSAAYVYPDGTQFHYTDITKRETLEGVKASSEEFSDIDVDAMANRGRIHITRNITVSADLGEASSTIREVTYTISARASSFSSKSQAKNFLMALANSPKDYLLAMNINYGAYLPMAKGAIDYETEIGFLKNQLEVLQGEYENLIKTYGGSFVGDTGNGTTLLAYSQQVKAYLDSGVLDNLLTQLRGDKEKDKSPIIKSPDCEEYYENLYKTLERECTIKKNALNNVLKPNPDGTGSSVIIDVDASVLKMSQEVEELEDKMKALEAYEGAKVDEHFLDKAYGEIEKLTNSYTETCKNVYSKASSVGYAQPGVIVSTGGMGLTMIVLLSLVAGVVIAAIAAYVAGYLALKKEKASAEAPLDTAANEQPEAEAQASEKENKE